MKTTVSYVTTWPNLSYREFGVSVYIYLLLVLQGVYCACVGGVDFPNPFSPR